MNKRKDEKDLRKYIIGIKVTEETREKINWISAREARPTSTQINIILEQYIQEYLRVNKIDWKNERKKTND